MAKSAFDPSALPSLSGLVAIVTGGHSGLGLATTTHLCALKAKVYIASRWKVKVEEAMKDIEGKQQDAQLEFLEMDLSDLESVKRSAEDFLKRENKLHILVNNAGIMCTPYSETPQGFEIQFATNYLSHFYLTCLLLPTLLSSALSSPANTIRIVNISSDGHAKLAPKEGIDFTSPAFPNFETSSTWTRYGISKLAQVLHSKEIARCYGEQGIISVSLHPGTVKTNLSNGPRGTTPWYKFIQPLVELGAPGPEKGAYNALWCAASPELKMEDNGGYFEPVGKKTGASACGKDGKMARKLWDWTERKLREVGFWIEE